VEVVSGEIAFYRENGIPIGEAVGRSRTLCVIAVPSHLSVSDFVGFVSPVADKIEHVRVLRDARPSGAGRYMVLLRFTTQGGADGFYRGFQGKPFSSFDTEVCHVVYVAEIRICRVDRPRAGAAEPRTAAVGAGDLARLTRSLADTDPLCCASAGVCAPHAAVAAEEVSGGDRRASGGDPSPTGGSRPASVSGSSADVTTAPAAVEGQNCQHVDVYPSHLVLSEVTVDTCAVTPATAAASRSGAVTSSSEGGTSTEALLAAESAVTVEPTSSPLLGGRSSSDEPPAGLTELPTCPVCLERLDSSASGVLTTICNHTFHCTCLSRWSDDSCPICRYCFADEEAQLQAEDADGAGAGGGAGAAGGHGAGFEGTSAGGRTGATTTAACEECGVRENVWMCLVCGHLGCGRLTREHALAHYSRTQHTYAIELATQRVWDYAGDGFVHRLIQNKGDGKLVEMPDPNAAYAPGDGSRSRLAPEVEAVNLEARAATGKKDQAVALEYALLLTGQLETQRQYFEGLLAQVLSLLPDADAPIREAAEAIVCGAAAPAGNAPTGNQQLHRAVLANERKLRGLSVASDGSASGAAGGVGPSTEGGVGAAAALDGGVAATGAAAAAATADGRTPSAPSSFAARHRGDGVAAAGGSSHIAAVKGTGPPLTAGRPAPSAAGHRSRAGTAGSGAGAGAGAAARHASAASEAVDAAALTHEIASGAIAPAELAATIFDLRARCEGAEIAARDAEGRLAAESKERRALARQAEEAAAKAGAQAEELAFLRQLNDTLTANQRGWEVRLAVMERQLKARTDAGSARERELEEQLRDVMFALDAQKQIEAASEDVRADLASGHVVVAAPGGAGTAGSGSGSTATDGRRGATAARLKKRLAASSAAASAPTGAAAASPRVGPEDAAGGDGGVAAAATARAGQTRSLGRPSCGRDSCSTPRSGRRCSTDGEADSAGAGLSAGSTECGEICEGPIHSAGASAADASPSAAAAVPSGGKRGGSSKRKGGGKG